MTNKLDRPSTQAGLDNVRARDRARRRALYKMLVRFPAEHDIVNSDWDGEASRQARAIRDRYPVVWQRVLSDEMAKETFHVLHVGR